MYKKINNKVIIYCFSKLGAQIARVLKQRDYDILIVEEDSKLMADAKELGYEVSNLSLMEDENILKLNIKDSNIKAFFCVSEDKHINLFVTLSVRNLNNDIKIISSSSDIQDNKTILLAGASKVINPYEIGALRIFRLLHKPLILDVLDNILFSQSNIEVAEITIEKGSIYDGVYLKDIDFKNKDEIIILGIQDKEIGDNFIFYSSGINHKIDAGDTIVILGIKEDLISFNKNINTK